MNPPIPPQPMYGRPPGIPPLIPPGMSGIPHGMPMQPGMIPHGQMMMQGPPPGIPPTMMHHPMMPQGAVISASPIYTIPAVTKAPPVFTTWVGKIQPSIEDEFVKKLLEQCGPIVNWKRVSDPTSGKLKAFGYCDFETPDGALHALSLLQTLPIDGAPLLVKVDEKTKKLLDERKAQDKAIGSDDDLVLYVLKVLIKKRERGENYRGIDVASMRDEHKASAESKDTDSDRPRLTRRELEEEEARLERIEKEKENRKREREEKEYRDRERDFENWQKIHEREREKKWTRFHAISDRESRDLSYDDSLSRSRRDHKGKRRRFEELRADKAEQLREIREEEERVKAEEERRLQEALRIQLEQERSENERKAQLEKHFYHPAQTNSQGNLQVPTTPKPPTVPKTFSTEVEDVTMETVAPAPESILDRTKIPGVFVAPISVNSKKVIDGLVESEENSETPVEENTKKKIKLSTLEDSSAAKQFKLERAKRLAESIPADFQALVDYPMDWAAMKRHDLLEKKVRNWVSGNFHLEIQLETFIFFKFSNSRDFKLEFST
eukprot:TRINITY_DN1376_c0_g1_i2.p1 TRINITY_DN1376_c0_g1~~TRINITY_DN1376_c0_g1_i2.p1  ORF type:complete len:575 (+),score=176.25 TRINITY_DN1376_c0_g1_i2:73-1725(+)